jgi:hypothetical protein
MAISLAYSGAEREGGLLLASGDYYLSSRRLEEGEGGDGTLWVTPKKELSPFK